MLTRHPRGFPADRPRPLRGTPVIWILMGPRPPKVQKIAKLRKVS